MITKINQSYLISNMRSLIEYGLKSGKNCSKNVKQPVYPTPSGMNIKVPQNPFLDASEWAKIKYRKDISHDLVIHQIPDGYTKDMGIGYMPKEKEDIMLRIVKPEEGATARNRIFDDFDDIDDIDLSKPWVNRITEEVKVGELVTPSHFYIKSPQLEPHYYIDELWSRGKNTGTNAIKDVVLESLKDPQTQGRVLLDACSIDGKTCPVGFYYKLGFRSTNPSTNADCAKWLLEGGKKENAPIGFGTMYLPKENIQHCLNYGLDIKA